VCVFVCVYLEGICKASLLPYMELEDTQMKASLGRCGNSKLIISPHKFRENYTYVQWFGDKNFEQNIIFYNQGSYMPNIHKTKTQSQ